MSTVNKTEENRSEGGRVFAALKAIIGDGVGGEGASHLPASAIHVEPDLFQQRGTGEHHIVELSKAIQGQGAVEPLTVIKVGEKAYLVDGHHRLAAYTDLKRTEAIPVRYFKGTLEEAVIESGAANSRAKLVMSTQERGDSAWRYVLLGGFTKAQIKAATQASFGTIAAMRRAQIALGADAYDHTRWAQARRAAEGKGMTMTEEEAKEMIERTAAAWAERLGKTFGSKMSDRPEIAAMALANYFGRRLDEVVGELKAHTSGGAWEDIEDDEEGDF